MTRTTALLALSTAALLASSASAADLLVPSQFPTIQAAVDFASPGDKVRIADGVYDEGVMVEGKFDLAIKGDDGVFVRMIWVDGCAQVSVKEITYTETSDFQLIVSNSNGVDVRFSTFQNGQQGVGVFSSKNVNVRDSDVMFLGLGVAMQDSESCRVAVAAAQTTTAIHLVDCVGTLIEECPLKNAGVVFVDASPFTTIRSNSFKGTRLGAVNTSNLLVEGNKFKKSEHAAIFFDNVFNSTIQVNAMKKAQADGIRIDNGGGNFLFANKIKKSGQVGVRLASTGNSIDQNQIKKSGQLDLLDFALGANSYGFNVIGTSNL